MRHVDENGQGKRKNFSATVALTHSPSLRLFLSASHKLYQFVIARENFFSFFPANSSFLLYRCSYTSTWNFARVSRKCSMVRHSMTTLSNLYQLIHIVGGGGNSVIALHRKWRVHRIESGARWASTYTSKSGGIPWRKNHSAFDGSFQL